MPIPNETRPGSAGGSIPPERLAELTQALVRETGFVHELRNALIDQRAGVASHEAEIVNATVDSIGRVLLALEEARGIRAGLVASLAGEPAPPIDRLEAALGQPLPPDLEAARAALRGAAAAVAHEVAINRAVLRRAVETGEAFIQALFSTVTDPSGVYGAGERREEAVPGLLLNRRA